MMTRSMLSLVALLVAGPVLAEDALPSFELPPVQVEASALPSLKELDPFGASKQPVWTLAQRFSFSDVYVRPEGMRTAGFGAATDFGYGLRAKSNTDVWQTAEVGLAHGWQVSLSLLEDVTAANNNAVTWGGRAEVRKALAPWGEIWGNPTLAASFTKREEGQDTLKLGVLLGGNLNDRWSWALNGNLSHAFDDVRANAATLSGGAMYAIKDHVLAVGVEAVAEVARGHEIGNQYSTGEYAGIGPSVAWRPVILGHAINVHAAVLPLNLRIGGNDLVSHNVLSFGISGNF